MSWRAALASGVLILLGSATPAGAATPAPTPSPTPAPTPLCAHAAELTNDAKPQQALALIDDARRGAAPDDACVIERDAALQAVAGADALMSQASEASGEAKPDWDAIRETIAAAEALDADVTTPEELGDLVKEHPAAEPDSLSRTWVDQVTTAWGDFTKKYLTPLGKYLLAATAVAALIVVLARLLLFLPSSSRASRSSRRGRIWINGGTAALLLLAGLVGAKCLPGAISATEVDWSTLLWLALLAALATGFTTYSLATRLRVSISVAGKSDDAGATEIVALLRELGAEPARGLEVPRGADVDILNGKAIADAPTGILAAALKVLQAVVGFVPWVVVVDDRDGETFAIVTRNGRSWDSAVIKKQPSGKDGPTVDTRKMAAAFILVALSRGYARSDFNGLAGTRDWRALGWQYVATTDRTMDRAARLWLLNDAVEADPGSALAQLALHHELYRTAETEALLKEYLTWLTDYPRQNDLPGSMQLRIAYNRLVAAVNRCATAAFAQDGVITAPADQATRDAASHLARLLAEDSDEPLNDHMQEVAIPLLGYGGARMDEVPGLPSPTRVYNEICRDAVTRGPSAELVERLRKNLQTPEWVDWARVDPMLQRVAALPTFQEAFAKPPPKMAAAQPFSAHAEALKKASLESPASLLGPTMTSTRLATLLDVRAVIATRLQSAARLAQSIEDDLVTFRFLIVESLFEVGIFSKRDIVESALDRHGLADIVIKAATQKQYALPDREELLDWFWRLKTFV